MRPKLEPELGRITQMLDGVPMLDESKLNKMYATAAFNFLSMGMKDKQALRIVGLLCFDLESMRAFEMFAKAELESLHKEIDDGQ